MNKLWKFVAGVGSKMGSRAKLLWSRIGFKSTSKIATWASKNKGWLQAVGLTSVSAAAGALVTKLVSSYIENKESVSERWMETTGTSTPERASEAKKNKVIMELRTVINTYNSYNGSDKDDDYMRAAIRMVELVNYLIHNDTDEEVRRVGVRASILIPSCLEAGVVPEEGFSNVLIIRAMRNLSEDAISAEDIEGLLDSVLDIAESGSPLKCV